MPATRSDHSSIEFSSCAPPKVSVCIITYNHERFIEQTLQSALAQKTSFDYELVVGEDLSTDATRTIVLDYQRRYPDRIRVLLSPKNSGPQVNALRTLAACRGEYVARLEGDDYWTDSEKLQRQADLLDFEPSAFICGARASVLRDGEREPYCITPPESSEILAGYGSRELFLGKWWFRTCTVMLRREMLVEVPRQFARDWAGILWLIAHTRFGKVCFLDRVVGVYREHAGGIFSSKTRAQRARTDAETLTKVIPLFSGSDRKHLQGLLHANIAALSSENTEDRTVPLRYAAMALRCDPGTLLAWLNVAGAVASFVSPGKMSKPHR